MKRKRIIQTDKKIRVSRSFILLASAFYFFSDSSLFFAFLLGSIMHELGHLSAIKLFGIKIEYMSFTITGLNIKTEYIHSYVAEVVIALCGPIINLLLVVVFSKFGRAIEFFYIFSGANAILFFFNILPVNIMDGGRALYALSSMCFGPYWAENIVMVTSIFSAFAMTVLGVMIMVTSGGNISLLIMAIFLIFSYIHSYCKFGRISIK